MLEVSKGHTHLNICAQIFSLVKADPTKNKSHLVAKTSQSNPKTITLS
jgi:hypothetical protein